MSDEKVRDLEGLTDLEIRRALISAILVVDVVDNQALSPDGNKTIADDLSEYTSPAALTVAPTASATLTNINVLATVAITGTDADGNSQTVTLSFTDTNKTDPQTTSEMFLTAPQVSTTGWATGDFDVFASDGRSLTFSQLAAASQRQNALSVKSERVLLVEYTGQNAANRASTFNTNNESDVVDNELAIRTGSTRHSFDDGYYAIEVHFYDSFTQNNSRQITVIPIESFNSLDFDNRQSIGAYFGGSYSTIPRAYLGIFRTSAASFGLHGSQSSNIFIQYIYGLRLTIELG